MPVDSRVDRLPRWMARVEDVRVLKTALRRSVTLMGVLFGLVFIVRLILDPIAGHETRKSLEKLDGFAADFDKVHVTIFGLGYDITGVKLVKGDRAALQDVREPLAYIERVHLEINWRELLHLRLAVRLRLDEPKIVILSQEKTAQKQPTAKSPPALISQLERITALKVDRIDIVSGELLFREGGEGTRRQEVWVHRLEMVAQNLLTGAPVANDKPTTVSAHGVIGRSGNLDLFVWADPFASLLTFAGQASLKGLKTSELYEFLEPKIHLQASRGTIDVVAKFASKGGALTGGVKPSLNNIEIRPAGADAWNRMKAWMADKSIAITSDRAGGSNPVATAIPINGTLINPDSQLWPTILGVIRNAFVEGLISGFLTG